MGMTPSSLLRARKLRARLSRLDDEAGFSLVEAMAAITILAVGIFAVAQALTFGLGSTGLSRQKLAARAALDQQMTHVTSTTDPDYWVNQTAQTYDPDGSGPLSAEPLVRVAGASPALQHYQSPFIVGSTTYSVYRYVTWVDSPTDGTGVSDAADGNNDGVSDANGHDEKRVTVVVTYTDELGRGIQSQSETSLFTDGKVVYKAPPVNHPPSVSCPNASVS